MTTTAPAPVTASPPAPAKIPKRHRVKVPGLLQMESTECGAASLGMVMGKYGRFVPLDELRIACGVSRDGATARNVVIAARSYGMETKAFKREPEQLKTLTFPLVIHWNFYHYLVVEGWYPGGWYLNDPGGGARTCDDDEFDRSFTGVAMQLIPGPDFVTGGKRPGVARRLLNSAGHAGPAILAAALIALLLLVPTMLAPQLMSLYGNELSGLVGISAVAALLGLVIALTVGTVLQTMQGLLSIRLSTKISLRLSAAVVQRLLHLPAGFHAQRGAASSTQRALLIDTMSVGVSALTMTFSAALLTSITAEVILFLLDPLIGVVGLVIAATLGLTLRTALQKAKDEAAKVVIETVEVGSLMASSLSQIESIKASGTEDGIIARGVAAQNRLLEANQRVGLRMLGLSIYPQLLTGLGSIIIVGLTMFQIINGRLEPGMLLAIIALSGILLGPVSQIVLALSQAQMLRPTLDQVDDVLNAETDEDLNPGTDEPAPGSLRGGFEAVGVTFGYSRLGPPVITDLDLHLRPGRRVALVGPSGCGKSTISRLVTGLYRPWSGEILLDGRTRNRHAPQVLTDGIALVDQDVTIFGGTIRENITLWDHTIPEADILQALQDAQLADDVAKRPGGLDAILSEKGADLSGGQRQRLEIARALARRPVLLVLDEATSSLDPMTEMAIDQALRRRGISCLVIAHRLSTIRDCDEIVVLDHGVVVERGTHNELMALDAAYARLVNSG